MIAQPPISKVQLLATGERMLLDVPDHDLDEWKKTVTEEEMARLRELWKCFAAMIAARTLKAGAEAAALGRAHFGRGWSAKNLLQLFWAYRDGGHKPGDWKKTGPVYPAGDWRILLRGYADEKNCALPEEFVRWLGEQWTNFKGRTDTVKALWRHVVQEIWLKGSPVPGYGTVDEWCLKAGRARPHPQLWRPGELPEGWSEATFRRRLPKRESTRQQVAHGYLAAHSAQPDQVLTDRSPLMPLQIVFLDDTRPDLRCTWFGPGGKGEIVYPLLVLALDACAGVDVAAVTKPRGLKHAAAEDALARKERHGVTQDMALHAVCGTLRFGIPPWGITFVHENAAACIPTWAKEFLHAHYGDRIRYEATSIFKERMIAHGFTEQGGAPYDKAPIEAFFRIVMTQTARLPGSTGPRWETIPGELKQIEKYELGLMEKAGGIETVFRMFQHNLLDFEQADAAIMAALRLLRFRTQHRLQGFDRVREWRHTPAHEYRPWSEFLALPPAEQDAVQDIIARLECPAERFCRKLLGVQLTPVDEDLLTYIEGPRRPVRVRDGKILLKASEHTDDAIVFREPDHPLLGEEHEGREFDAAISRDGGRLVLTDQGKILGHVLRQDRVVRGSEEWKRETGRVRAARVADRELLRGYYLADTATALAEMQAHNAATAAAVALAAAQAPGTRIESPRKQATAARRKGEKRARLDRELAEASRAETAPAAPTGSLYEDASEP